MSCKKLWGITTTTLWGAVMAAAILWASAAGATITQGDISIYGSLESREAGRWGEGGSKSEFLKAPSPPNPGYPAAESGGSFDFNRWDLVEMRQIADLRADYHLVKNYNLLGRLDTLFLENADLFALYRPWYDAFPDLKHGGIAPAGLGWPDYVQQNKIQQFQRDDLREYYAQLNFTDNFSMRIGKQQVIWSEADALSGTEVTNPVDLRYHWTHFESPENIRRNLRMVKFNYILPDLWKSTENGLEAFWIPGDWEGPNLLTNSTYIDARSPYIARVPQSYGQWPAGPNPFPLPGAPGTLLRGFIFNSSGVPVRGTTFAEQPPTVFNGLLAPFPSAFFEAAPRPLVFLEQRPSNSIHNSEFGARLSTLLPIGNGLQTSLIYLFEARSQKIGLCTTCTVADLPAKLQPGTIPFPPGGGVFLNFSLPAVPIALRLEDVRTHWLGMTGTYYDKDLTDMVFRYDFLYAPKVAVNYRAPLNGFDHQVVFGGAPVPIRQSFCCFPGDFSDFGNGARWTEETRFILAADRPTYIPWLSKQHTFLTFQNVVTWWPDLPAHAVPFFGDWQAKQREISDLFFAAATNWLMDGSLLTTNVWSWDVDDTNGFVESTNAYRYSRNVVFGLNLIWYLGRSGRYTDPYLFSRDQRMNELEFTFTYEL